MKTSLLAMVSPLLILTVALSPVKVFSQQVSDTLVVSALPPGNLNHVITGDTTSTGERKDPNRVYVLQQTGSADTTYFIDATIVANYSITIIGKPNPVTGHIPVIAPYINGDNSSPSVYILETKSNSSLTFKNLYWSAWRTDSTVAITFGFQPHADSVRVVFDHCVSDGDHSNTVNFIGNHGTFIFKNTEFKSQQNIITDFNDHPVNVDTVEFINCTWYANKFGMDLKGWIGYLEFNHNTVFLDDGTLNPIYNDFFPPELTNAVITNNIFYGCRAQGADSAIIKTMVDQRTVSVIEQDSLTLITNPPYNLKESDRNILLENNVYYWPKAFYDYWTSVSDTATDPGLITPPVWMDSITMGMFNNKTSWPGLTEADNDSVDPEFSSTIETPSINNFITYIQGFWATRSANNITLIPLTFESRSPLSPEENAPTNWASTQGYPVVENFRYSNTALMHAGTDGKALGDLDWFPEQLTGVKQISNGVPSKFDLSQNYPNPFNPTTDINYKISQSGFVSLEVFNVLGQKVATLYQGYERAGSYSENLNAENLASGVYLYRLQEGTNSITKKMIFLK
jgi:Secretion system C-terminal sorting domain